MNVRVGTLRAASALFTVVGSCVQRPNGVVSVIFGHSTLRPYMPICQYTNIPIYQYTILLLPVVLSPVLTPIGHSAVIATSYPLGSYFPKLHNAKAIGTISISRKNAFHKMYPILRTIVPNV